VFAAVLLAATACANAQTPTLQQQVTQHEQALASARASSDRKSEAQELNLLGMLSLQAGQNQKALELFNQALLIRRELGDPGGEAKALNNIGGVYDGLGDMQKALDFYGQALPIFRQVGDRRNEANTLNNIGAVYDNLGEKQKALDCFNLVLPLQREVGDRRGEATTLNNIGSVYDDLGQRQKALDFYNQALPIRSEVADRRGEAATLSNIGLVYDALGQKQKALDLYNQALSIRREVGDRRGEASSLNNIGVAYSDLGQKQKALDFYNQALLISHEMGDRSGEATTLVNIGAVCAALGEKQKALDFYNQALSIHREVHDPSSEAITLNDIGKVYFDLGQDQKALDFYNQALPLRREVGDRGGEATTLSNLGSVYDDLGDKQKALDFYNQALPLERAVGARSGEASTLNNIGSIYDTLGQPQKALDFYNQALPVWREIGDRSGEAATLLDIGIHCDALGDGASALRDDVAALSLARAIGDPDLEGAVDDSLMLHFRHQHQPLLAIHFGVEAVNNYQQIRSNISGLDKQLQAGFAKSKSDTYRTLAELLVVQNRLADAEHVLDLVKDAELNEIVRGAADKPTAKTTPLPLSDADRAAEASIATEAANANDLTQAGFDYDQLRAIPAAQLTGAQQAQLDALSAKITAGNKALTDFFQTTLFNELGGAANSADANTRIADTKNAIGGVSQLLTRLPASTLALYTLIGDQHSYIIVTTAHTRRSYAINAGAGDLGTLILALRQQLQSSSSDPRPSLEQLDHLLLDPIADDLADAAKQSPDGIPTLLWSLDGNLRYIPVSALYDSKQPDGRQYLVERARNVVINSASQMHLADAPSSDTLSVAALGVSNSYDGLPALSGVTVELDSVARDPAVAASHGPIGGKLYANEAFTLPALEGALGNSTPIVHIASHFIFKSNGDSASPGGNTESYLLLGGAPGAGPEHELTLSSFESTPELSFQNTRLVTLSACGTAEIGNATNGREIDSLGMVLQRSGAAAVLATLWSVNDASTSQLMSDFYRRWAATPGIEKIEALRQAQIALLRGSTQPSASTSRDFGAAAPAQVAAATMPGYSHPYFWAPFVLTGNFR
jgi:CHAT domain-containing protein/tetratricopeptide (TPR) repeat protein